MLLVYISYNTNNSAYIHAVGAYVSRTVGAECTVGKQWDMAHLCVELAGYSPYRNLHTSRLMAGSRSPATYIHAYTDTGSKRLHNMWQHTASYSIIQHHTASYSIIHHKHIHYTPGRPCAM